MTAPAPKLSSKPWGLRIWSHLIVALLAFAQMACATSHPSTGKNSGKDDSAVLQAILTPLAGSAYGEYLVLASKPSAPGLDREWIEARLGAAGVIEKPTDLAQMISSYQARNSSQDLPPDLDKAKIVESEVLSKMFAGDVFGGWKRFWAEFPGADALIDLSLPGYSPERKWAIACYSVARGSLAGEVWVALLHKENSTWTVKWREILFQS